MNYYILILVSIVFKAYLDQSEKTFRRFAYSFQHLKKKGAKKWKLQFSKHGKCVPAEDRLLWQQVSQIC